MLNLDFLKQCFDIKKFECGGVDGIICKIHLQAKREGQIYSDLIGINLVVKNTNQGQDYIENEDNSSQLIHEIKRSGLLVDRYVDLELRVNDQLIIYIQRASA